MKINYDLAVVHELTRLLMACKKTHPNDWTLELRADRQDCIVFQVETPGHLWEVSFDSDVLRVCHEDSHPFKPAEPTYINFERSTIPEEAASVLFKNLLERLA